MTRAVNETIDWPIESRLMTSERRGFQNLIQTIFLITRTDSWKIIYLFYLRDVMSEKIGLPTCRFIHYAGHRSSVTEHTLHSRNRCPLMKMLSKEFRLCIRKRGIVDLIFTKQKQHKAVPIKYDMIFWRHSLVTFILFNYSSFSIRKINVTELRSSIEFNLNRIEVLMIKPPKNLIGFQPLNLPEITQFLNRGKVFVKLAL